MRWLSRIPMAALPVVLAASVEGYWSCPASTGYTVSCVILENGQTWGVYWSGSAI